MPPPLYCVGIKNTKNTQKKEVAVTDPSINFVTYLKGQTKTAEYSKWVVTIKMGKLNSKNSIVCCKHFQDNLCACSRKEDVW